MFNSFQEAITAIKRIFSYERVPATIRAFFPSSLHLSCSKTGWMNSDLFVEFIKDVFYPHVLEKHGPNKPVILFVDGHASHMGLEVRLLCEELNILLIQLYPNSTFLMQPADVSCFKSLKVIWRNVVREHNANFLNNAISKAHFGDLMKKTFDQLSPQTIKNGFRASGLYPWDSNNIDYTKCLGKSFIREESEVVAVDEDEIVAVDEDKVVAGCDSFVDEEEDKVVAGCDSFVAVGEDEDKDVAGCDSITTKTTMDIKK